MKYIIILLTISTVIAVSVALFDTKESFNFTQILPSGTIEITFLIAFLGWMPAPLRYFSMAFYYGPIEKDKTAYI